jgi:cyclopropane fatty-acyl-phospholipid synthase-like methyltransferase
LAFINRSVEWITSRFGVDAGTKIADFGCGPGLYTTRLAEKQAEVTGIDFSQRSIQYAQDEASGRGLSIEYLNQNYLECDIDNRFDSILMIMCDFCALSPDQRRHLLLEFHRLLESGGHLLLDVYSPVAFEKRKEAARYELNLLNGFWSPSPYYGFLNTFKYDEEKVTLDKYTIVESKRIRTVYNWLQRFTPEALEQEFAECGFAVEATHSDVAGSTYSAQAPEFAVVAKPL